jgi:hypothetical protein
MAGGYTVRASELATGGQAVGRLSDTSQQLGSDAVSAIGGMSSAAGHPGLANALMSAAETGLKTFLDMTAAYTHAQISLAETAGAYLEAEADTTEKIQTIGRPR